jgi:SAM-dependent methyltransferase
MLAEPDIVYPPGTILQHMYLSERMSKLAPGRFIEVGVGQGHVSNLLLRCGWNGTGYDLSSSAISSASQLNRQFMGSGRFAACHDDWLSSPIPEPVDLIVSSMVLEHLDDDDVHRYFEKAASSLRSGGRGILLVPGSPHHWGIEDDIAGHYRRYTSQTLSATVREQGWRVLHIAGLTYPMANITLALSDVLVRRAEQQKQALPIGERTELSGDRHVTWKTEFPKWVGLLLNEATLRPFHWWQKRCAQARHALVIYCECAPEA